MIRRILVFTACASLALAQGPPVEEAWTLLSQGHRAQAVQLLEQIIKSRPRDADARLLLGSVLMEEGNRSESIAQLTEAARLRPNSAKAQNALGEGLNAFGDFQTARGPFEKAVALDPSFAQAQVNLGLVLLRSGDDSAAARSLDRAIQLLGKSPDAAYPLYLRAKSLTGQGQVKKAAADLDDAVRLQPHFAEAWSDLGEARKTLLDNSGALAAFEKAVEFAPSDPVAQTRVGSELLAEHEVQPALPHLEKAVQLDPGNQSALYSLERALREGGRTQEAEAVRKNLTALLRERDQTAQNGFKAIQLNDEGAALEKAGKLRQALKKYREALKLDPEHTGIRVNFAAALLRLGRWNEGVAELREVLQRDPGNRAVKKALEEALAHPPAGTRQK
ncbi:MAG TPA: tetratricopeptide repeat protein [Terriglobia bacterium]|nr:tetratricopeptide repeat protein [Terriglobia bacterium]